MKNVLSNYVFVFCSLLIGIIPQTAKAQVTVAGSAGSANGTYATLKGAFDTLNLVTSTQAGKNIVITITSSTTETAAAVLNPPQIGAWASLTIYPTSAGLSITGNMATPLIDFNGADNVTIDGRVNRTGDKNLVISNTSTSSASGTSTFRFINDASRDTIKYCILKGSSTATTGAILFFSTTTGTTGNDDNTIEYNDITSCLNTQRPVYTIYSWGTSAKENSGNFISNNNIFDFLNPGVGSYGIYLYSNTTAWTITDNSFYETTSFAPTGSGNYAVILIENSSGTNFTISNNNIGGNAASCVGTWVKTNSKDNIFYGISLNVGTGTASNVQGNTITHFSYSNSFSGNWLGIYAAGKVNIGTTTGNIIGATSGTGSIIFNNAASGGIFYGIELYNSTGNAQNNTIASIIVSNTTETSATNFRGIYVAGISCCTVGNNTIGSTTEINSIHATSNSTNNAQNVYGIYSDATKTLTISGNTIANITNGTINTAVATTGLINGIYVGNGSNVISNNVIRDVSIANANNLATHQVSVAGIVVYNITAYVQNIVGNTIYNLTNTYAGFTGSVVGVYYGSSSTPSIVSGNFIHSVSVTGAGSTVANLYGIKINSGTTTYSNNIINLGGNTATTLYGIYETGSAVNTNKLYFNSVYIGGAPTSGANNSYAVYSADSTNIRDFRNNIFFNARSNASATGKHFALYMQYFLNTGLTIDNNDYYAGGTGGMLGYHTKGAYAAANDISTIGGWKIATAQDVNSVSINPSFESAGGTAAINYYPSATLTGVAVTGVSVDYSNYTRNAPPKMGAVEFTSAPGTSGTTVGVYSGVTLQASYLNIHEAFDKINDGTHSGSIIVKITGSQVLSSSAVLNASGVGGASYTDITVYPTTSGITVSGNGNFTEPLIDLNGADNVVIDGRVDATGSTKSLTISNPSVTGSTIRFINDATGNTIKYCTIKGSSTDALAGILCFSTTNGTTGNDNNVIDHNDITNALDANRPVNAIYSLGTGTGTENSENTISNNTIYDFLNRGMASNGINLSTNTTAWTITGNSLNETASFAPIANVQYAPIFVNAATGQNFTVSNNFIGGSGASCSGNAWTKTGEYSNIFFGISLNVGTTIASNIQGNTITNFKFTNTVTNGNWFGINVAAGIVNIGTTTGNIIGATTGTGSIIYTSAFNGTCFYGIKTNSQVIIQNNTIGSITIANSVLTNSAYFYGIQVGGSGNVNVMNNVVGSTTTANSINDTSSATSSVQYVYGIYSNASGVTTIKGNTISKLTNGTKSTSTSVAGLINGIYLCAGSNIITNNIVRDLTIANANSSVTYTVSVGGIVISNTSVGKVQTITGNTIYSLSNSFVPSNGAVVGIYYNGPITASSVAGNFIHSLSVAGDGSTPPAIFGIKIASGTTTYSNNIISLSSDTTTTIYGIYETGATNNNNSLYFNTVYIGGSVASGLTGVRSFALWSNASTNIRDFRNNIFSNTRSTNGGSFRHYAVYFNITANTNLTLNNNVYFTPNTGGVLGYYNSANVLSLPLITGSDANSVATNPKFSTAGGTSPLHYSTDTTLNGVSGTGILADYSECTRNATTPKMGAVEFSSGSVSNTVDLYVGENLQASFTNIKTAFDKINDGTYTGVIALKITGSQELTASAVLNGSGIGAANYTSVSVYPTTIGLTISGNVPAPLIDLNGADNVTIDGRVNATGDVKNMTITNTSTSSQYETSTIRFINDATNNTMKYCTVKGSGMATTGGIIYFATTSGTSGNDNNVIDNNDITCASAANRPLTVVRSIGLISAENSNITISNNNIFDFFNKGTASYGINIAAGSTNWTISGNSFYETTPFEPTANAAYVVIFNDADAGFQNFTVSNNYIGGRAHNCAGLAWTITSTFYNTFTAMYIMVGTTTASNIQNNTIKNFNHTSTNASWLGILCSSGNVNVGTTAGNVIGSATENNTITLTHSTTGGDVTGIYISSTGTTDVRNNTIGSITTINTSALSTSIYGINKAGAGTATISNNFIGSTDAGTTNSFNATSLSAANAQSVIGINNTGAGAVTISGNTISKLMNGTTNTTGIVCGISNNGSIGSSISNNFIHTLLGAGTTTAGVYGLKIVNGITTYSNNIISLGGSTATNIYGIYENGIAGTDSKLYFNTVYIGGSLVSGTDASYSLYSNASTNMRDFRNNIFSNERTTAGGTSLHYAGFFNYAVSSNLTLSNNDYYQSGTGGVLGRYNNADVTSVPLISGIDANSVAIGPSFALAGGTLVANYKPSAANIIAATGTGITTDYNGTTRSVLYPYMGAYEDTESPLPVELVSFTAIVSHGGITLAWQTATEVNNRSFEVERALVVSKKSVVWKKVGEVAGSGSSNSPKNYSFIDRKATPCQYSYRLKQIDNDGAFSYSHTVEVGAMPTEYGLMQNYPNPFNPTTTIRFTLPVKSTVKIDVYNALGQVVENLIHEEREAGYHEIEWNASRIASGVYFYRIEAGTFNAIKKMMVIK